MLSCSSRVRATDIVTNAMMVDIPREHVTNGHARDSTYDDYEMYLHLLERIQLLWPIDLDMRNIFRWKGNIEELMFIVGCVRHGVVS
jgi:hypothetical protein